MLGAFKLNLIAKGIPASPAVTLYRSKKSVIASGSVQVSNTQSKFNGSALYTPGAGGANHCLALPYVTDLLWSQSTDYTMECWTYHTAWPTSAGYPTVGTGEGSAVTFSLSRTNGYTRWCFGFNATGKLTFDYNNSGGYGGTTTQESTASGVLNTWQHIALVKQGTSIKGYVNGVQKISTTINGTVSIGVGDEIPRIGSGGYWSTTCYYDEVRWSNSARYTANFTPSTIPFINDDNTVLLLHMDGTNSTTFFDDDNGSRRKSSPFALGNSIVSTTQNKFDGTSLALDGTGDYLQINNDFSQIGNFTIEFWYYPTNLTGYHDLWCVGTTDSTNRMSLATNGTGVQLFAKTLNLILSSTSSLNINAWNHIAVTRDGSTLRMYINGTQNTNTYTYSGTFGYTDGFMIGTWAGKTSYAIGYIDEFRISNSTRYTATFTPSTTPFVNDTNTQLLLHMNGTNGSTVFTDDNGVRSQKGVQALGNAQISTAQSKFGGSSAAFDGVGDYLRVIQADNLASDFTIEFWIRYNNVTDAYQFSLVYGASQTGGLSFYMQTSTFRLDNFNVGSISAGTLSAGTWYHIAAVRSGSTVTLYKDGVSQGTASWSTTFGNSNGLYIGGRSLSDYWHNGHIDELRISNTARYTGNFTPSTTPFQNDANTLLLLHMDGTNTSTVFTDDNGVVPVTV